MAFSLIISLLWPRKFRARPREGHAGIHTHDAADISLFAAHRDAYRDDISAAAAIALRLYFHGIACRDCRCFLGRYAPHFWSASWASTREATLTPMGVARSNEAAA